MPAFIAAALAEITISQVIGFVIKTVISFAISSLFAPKKSSQSQLAEAQEERNRPQTLTFSSSAQPWRKIYGETRVGGTVVFQHVTNSDEKSAAYLHLVIVFAAHECEAINDIYFDDEIVPLDGSGNATGKYAGYALINKHLGAASQSADSTLMLHAPEKWTSSHTLSGHAYIYARLLKNDDLFPRGVPNISAVVQGAKIYDPRDASTAWSDNAALCLADYYADTRIGLGAGYGADIDTTALTVAANICDEDVTLADATTEKRYTCNGVIDSATHPAENIGRLLGAMAGRSVYVGGAWQIHAGAYVSPSITLTEDDFAGALKIEPRFSARDTFNGVKGTYVAPVNHYQKTDFPALASDTYKTEDNNERIWLDMELPFTDSPTMAQRIAKITLLRVRQQLTVSAPFKLGAYAVQPMDTVQLSFDKYGWSSKVFEVMETTLATENDALVVTHALRETASAVYDWSTSEESAVDLAPNTTLPDPWTVLPPGVPSVVEEQYDTFGTGVKVKVILSWAASADAQAVNYELQWKKSGDTVYDTRADIRSLNTELLDLEAATYNFRVRARNTLQVPSAWAELTYNVIGLTDPPAAVAGFSVIKTAGFALAQWALADDLDVRIGGTIVIRHSPLTTGAAWENGVILDTFPGGSIQGTVPLITGTYMAKFIDSSGNYSATATSFVATEGMVTGFTTVATSTQATAFSGTKTNVALDTTLVAIKLDGTTLIDSMATSIDDWPFIDSLGGVSGTGSYAFDTYLDMSTVATRRFESDITALSFDTGDLIDLRLNNIDDWDSIDGGVINDCDVTLYARTTDDNPAGSPTWGAWTPFFVADFTCRAAQFKLDFVSGASTHNIAVSQLTVHVKIPA